MGDRQSLAGVVRRFVEERCEVHRTHTASRSHMQIAFAAWCARHGFDPEGLEETLPVVVASRVFLSADTRAGERYWDGISIRRAPGQSWAEYYRLDRTPQWARR